MEDDDWVPQKTGIPEPEQAASPSKAGPEEFVLMEQEQPGQSTAFPPLSPCQSAFRWDRLAALLVKNFIRMWRNLGFLVFQFIIPTVQVIFSYKCVGVINLLGWTHHGPTLQVCCTGTLGRYRCSAWRSDGTPQG